MNPSFHPGPRLPDWPRYLELRGEYLRLHPTATERQRANALRELRDVCGVA